MDISPIKHQTPNVAIANNKDKEIDDLKAEILRLQSVIDSRKFTQFSDYIYFD